MLNKIEYFMHQMGLCQRVCNTELMHFNVLQFDDGVV